MAQLFWIKKKTIGVYCHKLIICGGGNPIIPKSLKNIKLVLHVKRSIKSGHVFKTYYIYNWFLLMHQRIWSARENSNNYIII